jgi:hypothetical protein
LDVFVLLSDQFVQSEDLADLISALFFVVVLSLAPDFACRESAGEFCEAETGLQGAVGVTLVVPDFEFVAHLLESSAEGVVFAVDLGEVLMEDGDLFGFGLVFSFEAAGVLVEKTKFLLIMFVIHR